MDSELALEIAGAAYQAALDPKGFQHVAECLSRAFRGAGVVVGLGAEGAVEPRYYLAGFHHLEALRRPVTAEVPWRGSYGPEKFGHFVLIRDIYPDEEILRTPFYREFMQPLGLPPTGPLVLATGDPAPDGGPVSGFVAYQQEGERPFDESDLAFGKLIAPHLTRAMEIHQRLRGEQHRREALVNVLNRLPMGVILLARDGHAVLCNRSAERALEECEYLSVEGGRLRAAPRSDDEEFQSLLADILEGGEAASRAQGVISLGRNQEHPPLAVMVAPLLAPDFEPATEAVGVVFLAASSKSATAMIDVLRSLYGLTPAEAELVALLVSGHSVDEAASERGVKVNTARGQLKNIFAKTGSRRQGDLLRLVLTGVAGIRAPDADDGDD